MTWVLLLIIVVLCAILVQALGEIRRLNDLLDDHQVKDPVRWDWP